MSFGWSPSISANENDHTMLGKPSHAFKVMSDVADNVDDYVISGPCQQEAKHVLLSPGII